MAALDYHQLDGKGLSYSRSLEMRRCPRKYYINNVLRPAIDRDTVTFSFGHAVGAGVQYICAGASLERAIAHVISFWSMNMFDEHRKAKKSLWHAIAATQKFYDLYTSGTTPLKDYKMATINGKPAVELTASIDLEDGYSYEMHIDGILKHKEKEKEKYMILELKTSGSYTFQDASYKNSDQAVGYSTVLDSIASTLQASASFTVLYVVYLSKKEEFVFAPYTKTPLHRANWLQSVLCDKETMEIYHNNNFWPARGEACFDFFRECEYFGMCHMENDVLRGHTEDTREGEKAESTFVEMEEPDFKFKIGDIIDRQLQSIQENHIPVEEVPPHIIETSFGKLIND